MTQTVPDSIVEKLQMLKAKADSAKSIGELQEAEIFAAKVQELLLKYKLDMTEIEYHQKEENEPIVDKRFNFSDNDLKYRGRRVHWIETLAQCIAEAYQCRILVYRGTANFLFVGTKRDIELSEYMFITFYTVAERISKREYMKFRRTLRNGAGSLQEASGYRNSFLEAFVSRLWQRFNEERNSINKEYSSSTALMRINTSIARVSDFIDSNYKLKHDHGTRPNQNFNHQGAQDGRKAADSLSLRANAMRSGNGTKQIFQ